MAKKDDTKGATMTKEWDHRTPTGRAAIDRAVAGKLGKKPKRVGDVAEALGMDKTVASRSLGRLVDAGRAVRTGERAQTVYTASA